MSTLSSSSTLAEVQAAYDDSASYAEDESVGKAAAFITACRVLLRRLPKRAVHGGRETEEIELDPAMIRKELSEARRWIADRSTATLRFASFQDFRD